MHAPLAPLLSAWLCAPAPDMGSVWAVPPGARAFAVAGLFDRMAATLLVVVPGENEAEELAEDIALFTSDVVLCPAWETLPCEHVSPNTATMAQRAQARHLLAGSRPVVVVASVRSAIQRVSPSPVDPVVVRSGENVVLEDLVHRLVGLGYHRTDRVEARGEIAVRGGIVDIFPAQAEAPLRLDFWGDTVDEVRTFSVATQRSEDSVEQMIAYPAREL
jgi:transcription-repair coupling factor (superfamily II helicase)